MIDDTDQGDTTTAAREAIEKFATDTLGMADSPRPSAAKAAPKAADTDSTEDDDTDEPTDADQDDDADASDDDPPAEDAEDDDDTEETEEEEEGEQPEKSSESGFEDAAKRHNLPRDAADIIKQLPKDQQEPMSKVFGKRLKEMEAGFTRAQQEARAYRKDEAALRGDLAFVESHPAEFMADVLTRKPELLTKLNELLDAAESPDGRKKLEDDTRAKREAATKGVQDRLSVKEQREARGDAVEAYVQKAARKAGIPYEFVAPAIVNEIRESETHDIAEAAIDAIVKAQAEVYARHVGAHRREERKGYVKEKAADAKRGKTGGSVPTAHRKGGGFVAPGQKSTKGLTLEQKMNRTAKRIAPELPA